MSDDAVAQKPGQLSLRRLERLSDVVYAVILLLLLATFRFAPADIATDEEGLEFFFTETEIWVGFAIGFLIVAYYWTTHQKYFSYLVKTNTAHSMLELIYLMALAMVPFSNQFLAAYPTALLPRVWISLDITLVGLMLFFTWSYATKNGRLVATGSLDDSTRTVMGRQALVMPVLAVVAAVAGFFYTYLWDAILVVGPLVVTVRKRG